jgi:hypothetical protein
MGERPGHVLSIGGTRLARAPEPATASATVAPGPGAAAPSSRPAATRCPHGTVSERGAGMGEAASRGTEPPGWPFRPAAHRPAPTPWRRPAPAHGVASRPAPSALGEQSTGAPRAGWHTEPLCWPRHRAPHASVGAGCALCPGPAAPPRRTSRRCFEPGWCHRPTRQGRAAMPGATPARRVPGPDPSGGGLWESAWDTSYVIVCGPPDHAGNPCAFRVLTPLYLPQLKPSPRRRGSETQALTWPCNTLAHTRSMKRSSTMPVHAIISPIIDDRGGEPCDPRRRAAGTCHSQVAPRKGAHAWPVYHMSNATS